jgi:hypothetical protein
VSPPHRRYLPRRYGPVGTVTSRFYRWRAGGVWQHVLGGLQAERPMQAARWTGTCTSSMPPSFCPAPSGGQAQAEALGRGQGGSLIKLHLRAEGKRRPITAVLSGGEGHEQIALDALLDQEAIRRPGCGRPRRVAGIAARLRDNGCAAAACARSSRPGATSAASPTSTMPSIACLPASNA